MAKASDILNKTGSGGKGPLGPSLDTIPIGQSAKKSAKPEHESVAAHKPDLGSSLHKPGKAQGGGGGSSARPKV